VAEFPALPFFTDAYLADTRHLTTEEHGAYLLLLMCAWRTRGCALKDDNRQLARMAGVSPTKWKRLRPVLAEFFTVAGGLWQQKKLTGVYETVAEKVERNRLNGAKGGRASAAKQARSGKATDQFCKTSETSQKFEAGWPRQITEAVPSVSTKNKADAAASAEPSGKPNDQATKTKAKTKLIGSSKPAETAHGEIAAAAGLDPLYLDEAILVEWSAAGADHELDMLPTIRRLAARQLAKEGKVPQHLAYYSRAVLEARDKRLGAVTSGSAHAAARPAKAAAIPFDRTKPEHWRRFLGDKDSRFRGDYLSRNWRVPHGHPEFLSAGLGPDPKCRFNPAIPADIYEEYGLGWGWQLPPYRAEGAAVDQNSYHQSEKK